MIYPYVYVHISHAYLCMFMHGDDVCLYVSVSVCIFVRFVFVNDLFPSVCAFVYLCVLCVHVSVMCRGTHA